MSQNLTAINSLEELLRGGRGANLQNIRQPGDYPDA